MSDIDFWLVVSFYVGVVVLIFLSLIHMIYHEKTPASMIAWVMTFILIPYFAVLLYAVLGPRLRSKRKYKSFFILEKAYSHYQNKPHEIEKLLVEHGMPRATEHNDFRFYFEAHHAYAALMEAIKNAQRSIYIQTYIWSNDSVSEEILDQLILKAQAGVQVKVLLDGIGSIGRYVSPWYFKKLTQAGGEVRYFMPVLKMPFRNYINMRNHRKIYLFDTQKLLTGGMNIGEEYISLKRKKHWFDILFLFEGSSVDYYYQIFQSDWNYSGEKSVFPKFSAKDVAGNEHIEVVPSGPDISTDALYEAILTAIYSATQRIWIVTPYFIPSISLQKALIIALHRGVDVQLITSLESDTKFADYARSSFMRELDEEGATIALFTKGFLHAKVMLYDNVLMVGSLNLDNRSLFLNYEIVSIAYTPKIIQEIEVWIEKLLMDSIFGMKRATKVELFFENFVRMFAPQL